PRPRPLSLHDALPISDAGFRDNVCRFLQNDPTSDTANYNATLALRQPAFLSPRHTASLALFAERRSEFRAYTRQDIGVNVGVTLDRKSTRLNSSHLVI